MVFRVGYMIQIDWLMAVKPQSEYLRRFSYNWLRVVLRGFKYNEA